MPRKNLAQQRAAHALQRIEAHSVAGPDTYGNYRSYVDGLPATIIMNGLGQALAMERAGTTTGHRVLFDDLDDWLRNGWPGTPYRDRDDILSAITAGNEGAYLRAHDEAMAYLSWLKRFAAAYLEKLDPTDANAGGEADEDGAEGGA